jgi:hypothetical protein
LTFNPTALPLAEALEKKRLLVRVPPRPLGASVRYTLVAPDVDAMLDGLLHYGSFPQIEADTLIARFSANWLIRASTRRTNQRPDLERLEGFDEVWALCARRPVPGWRILGRFFDKNVLVLTRAWQKDALVRQYAAASAEVIGDWNELFGDAPPHSSIDLRDYLVDRL